MKKTLSFLLALCLLLTASSALADVDFSYVKENPDFFEVYEGDVLRTIRSTMTSKDLSFEHAHESDYYYSTTYFELGFLKNSNVIYPMLAVNYFADNPLNITAVSFDVEGTRYTFAVNPDEPKQLENGIQEKCLIYFGPGSIDFLIALEDIVLACENADELMEHRIPAVLHGDEELTVTLSNVFLLDYYFIIEDAYKALNGQDSFALLAEVESDMTTENVSPAGNGGDVNSIMEKLRNKTPINKSVNESSYEEFDEAGNLFIPTYLNYYRQNPGALEISDQDDLTMIYTMLIKDNWSKLYTSTKDSSFCYANFLIFIPKDYSIASLLLIVECLTDKPLNTKDISFDIDGIRYTFSVKEVESTEINESYKETITIFFGRENKEFINALGRFINTINLEDTEQFIETNIPIILHGDTDSHFVLDYTFIMDFICMNSPIANLGALDFLEDIETSNTLTVKSITQ